MAPTDDARKWTDAELEALERRMAREYQRAAREMRGKQAEWLKAFDAEREQREKALDDTMEAAEEHKRWLQSQAARRDWMGDMADQLAESAHQANVRASDMVNGHIPRIFSENANRAAFSIDKALRADTRFTLVNEEAVRHVMEAGVFDVQLIREVVPDAPELGPAAIQSLRKREVDYPKDMRWNRQKFTSAITQGILQGEGIPSIVKRTESIFGQNRDAAIRAARTATTNAENAGRMNSFERAQRLGIDMEIEWEATLDGRTRSSHRELDGERIKLGQVFSNGLRWPGDPQGPGHEVWNCRCRADGRVVGFDGKRGDWADERGARWSRLPKGTTYEQWKAGKAVSRAESYGSEAGRVAGAWYAQRAAGGLSPLREDTLASATKAVGKPEPPSAAPGLRQASDETEYKEAVEYYASGEGMYINRIIRDNGLGALDETERAIVEKLDEATKRDVIDSPTLYRSVDASSIFGEMTQMQYEQLTDALVYHDEYSIAQTRAILDRAKPGKSITEKGFMSTSERYDVVSEWYDFTGSDKPITLELSVPSGTRGCKVYEVTPEVEERDPQREVLLPRGIKYAIDEVSARDGLIYVRASIVDSGIRKRKA